MGCDNDEVLNRFLDGDLSQSESELFQAHLKTCLVCQRFLSESTRCETLVRKIVNVSLPLGQLKGRVMERINRELPHFFPNSVEKTGERNFLQSYPWFLGFIGILSVVLFSLFILPVRNGGKQEVSQTFLAVSLGNEAKIGSQSFLIGKSIPIEVSTLVEFQGPTRIQLSKVAENYVTWDGHGFFSLDQNAIHWEKGEGEFDFSLFSPVELHVKTTVFNITGTKIKISGNIESEVLVTLIQGKASYRSPSKSGWLTEMKSMTIKKSGQVFEDSAPPANTPLPHPSNEGFDLRIEPNPGYIPNENSLPLSVGGSSTPINPGSPFDEDAVITSPSRL
ncbi:zf-HC2 domain-containing protein [bacterium]|nr:zf-HC2 domain-containing protein [bacterium]